MVQFVKVLLRSEANKPTTTPTQLQVNPEDVSHLYRDEHNRSWISFRNGKIYELFNDIESVKGTLQLK